VPVAVIGYRDVDAESPEEDDEAADSPETIEGALGPQARFAVVGDADFIANGLLLTNGNTDLFINTINWLAEQDDLVAIAPRSKTATPMALSTRQILIMLLVSLFLVPLAVLGSGVAVWLVRRWKT
jgi:ABC-type uncharacterized transport system involved in gliding motility auxiliary subunit